MPKIIGIDLGTTNSCVAVVDVTSPQVISNREGSRTTPSVVGFTEDGERLVGQIAKRQAITNPFNTVFAIKRLIGRKFDSEAVSHAKKILPYNIVPAPNGDVKVKIRERDYSPEEISAFVLTEIKDFAEEFLGEPVTEAIITVPAYFNDSQRQATRDAGKIAGLDVLRIINEPTAAALAYGIENRQNQIIAVYDLGGGTFDVSILKLKDGLFEVLSTSGDTYLGGEDFDKRIMDWLLETFRKDTGISLERRPHGPAAAQGGRRAREVRALHGAGVAHHPAVHLRRCIGPQAPQRRAHPAGVRAAGGGSHPADDRTRERRPSRRRRHPPADR